MSVNSYLAGRASNAVLSANEQDSINRSIGTLQTRLKAYFGSALTTHFRFGSSTRGTILPRKMDPASDIDYMIVFSDGGFTPQTYLNRLRQFVEYYYNTSEVKQSSPTIELELNHIKFDLVPALSSGFGNYQIPSSPTAWQYTNPNDFNSSLTSKNSNHSSLIKPTIRLLKFWNAENGFVFESFSLEKWVVDQSYWFETTQRDFLFSTFDKMPIPTSAQWRKDRVDRAKRLVGSTRELEKDGYPYLAESEVQKLIPA